MEVRAKMDNTLPSNWVDATINYYDPINGRPVIDNDNFAKNAVNFDPHLVQIEDVSRSGARPTLDAEGYLLVKHQSEVRDFFSQEEVRQVYARELEALIRDLTGADHAKANIGITRSVVPRGDSTFTAPFPHIDASEKGIFDLLDYRYPDRPKEVARWAYINTWRALTPAPLDQPLAVCDARSVKSADLVSYDSSYAQASWESLILRYNPGHRWAYFSEMGPGDLLVFKTYDSDPTRASAVAHSAFVNPQAPANAIPRVSIECRVYAAWSS